MTHRNICKTSHFDVYVVEDGINFQSFGVPHKEYTVYSEAEFRCPNCGAEHRSEKLETIKKAVYANSGSEQGAVEALRGFLILNGLLQDAVDIRAAVFGGIA